MYKVRTTPAVITALALFLFVLLVPALPASAETTGTCPSKKALTLSCKCTKLQKRVSRLATKVRSGRCNATVVKNIVNVNRSIASLNRNLATLNRAYLTGDTCDKAGCNRLLTSNARAVKVSKNAVKLSKKTRKQKAIKSARAVSQSVATLTSLSTKARAARVRPAASPATASTSAAGHPASYMIDGNAATAWIASSKAVPQKVTIDLGSSKAVTASAVDWAVEGAVGYRVFGSNDGAAWYELANQDANLYENTDDAISGTWRYIRMRIGYLQSGSAGIYEWRVTTATTTSTTPAPITTPSATPSATASPTASATPTATPSATPTATATVTPTTTQATLPVVPSGYTLVRDQTINNLVTNGLSNKYFYNCTFTGGSSSTAVLSFTGTTSNVVFDSCTIAKGGGWNGVTINDANGRVHDITFKNCLFKAQGRMGFECTSRPTSAATQYQRVNILGSTFEPQGNEAISYDGGYAAGGCTISGNTIQGAGNDPAQEFSAGLEINGPSSMTVENNRIYACRGPMLNLQMHSTQDCGWTVRNNILDASKKLQATAMDKLSQVVLAFNVYGGTFPGNQITSSAPGGSVAYLSGCQNMDWRTSTWKDASSRSGYNKPTQVSCSGNRF